jgi:phage/plasmid primase, P4 family, C-terminal domain
MPDAAFTSSQPLEEIRAQIEARILEENQLLPPPESTPSQESPVDRDLVRQCLANNERGDGILYSRLHRGTFVYVKKSQEWLKFSGHFWEQDVYQEHLRAVEKVALTYKGAGDALQPVVDQLGAEFRELKARAQAAVSLVADAEKAIKEAVKKGEGLPAAEQQYESAKAAAAELDKMVKAAAAELGTMVTEQKAYHRRIDRLRAINGASKCAEWAHIVEHPLAISGDELDQQPWLLPCKNGIIDLQTGELRPGVPGDWLTKACPVEYRGFDEPCPEWEKFLASIQPDTEILGFLPTLFGYGITGHSIEQFIAVFMGPGRNGKGVLFEILEMILGPLYWTIQAELLLENKNARSSAGASPDIVALKGRRICAASETDQGRRISCARVKELTGSDTLNARLLYDKHDTNFRPTHKLFLRTNNVPEGLTKDFALRERLLYITFPYRFVDDPAAKAQEDPPNAEFYRLKDRGLKDRLVMELPGILAWLVRGCAQWQADGKLKPPESIRNAVEELRNAEDYVGRFIADCCEQTGPEQWEVYSLLYGAFVRWYCEEECIDKDGKDAKFIPSSKRVSADLKSKGYDSPDKKATGGTKRVYGLKLVAP